MVDATPVEITARMIEVGAEAIQRACDAFVTLPDYAASVAAMLLEAGICASVAYLDETELQA